MNEILLLGVLTVLCFVLGIIGIVLGAVKKKYPVLFGGIGLILLGIAGIPYTSYVAFEKGKAKLEEVLNQRPGDEIYSSIMGEPDSCVMVIQSQDQTIPKIDGDIWIHASICPGELERLIQQDEYTWEIKAIDSIIPPAVPEYWELPPSEFDSLIIYEVEFIPGKSARKMWVSMDSTQLIIQDIWD